MISLVANPGHGKTRIMVDMAKDLTTLGIPVYLDFHVKGINCEEIIPGQLSLDYPASEFYLENFDDALRRTYPRGSVAFLDEIIKAFDNRLSVGTRKETKERAELTQKLMQLRKKGVKVVNAYQIAKTVEWRLAYLSELFLIPEPTAYKFLERDNDIINVEFAVSAVANKGIFGFEELPDLYYMDEERFWLYADDYDTNEPVLSEKEKKEILQERKPQRKLKSLLNNELPGSKILHNSDKSPDYPKPPAQNSEIGPQLAITASEPITKIDERNSGRNKQIILGNWQPAKKTEPVFDSISERQFINYLEDLPGRPYL